MKKGDLAAIMSDYAANTVVIAPPGLVAGQPAEGRGRVRRCRDARRVFATLTDRDHHPGVRTMETSIVPAGPDAARLKWVQFRGTRSRFPARISSSFAAERSRIRPFWSILPADADGLPVADAARLHIVSVDRAAIPPRPGCAAIDAGRGGDVDDVPVLGERQIGGDLGQLDLAQHLALRRHDANAARARRPDVARHIDLEPVRAFRAAARRVSG